MDHLRSLPERPDPLPVRLPAVDAQRAGCAEGTGVRLHRRAGTGVLRVRHRGRETLARRIRTTARPAGSEGNQPRLSIPCRAPDGSGRARGRYDPGHGRRAGIAPAHHRGRMGAGPVRGDVQSPERPRRGRFPAAVPLRGQTPDAASRPAGQFHGEACAAQCLFERLAPAPVIAEQGIRRSMRFPAMKTC